MDKDRPASSPKKLRFAPKATSARRLRKANPPLPEPDEAKESDDESQSLLRRFKENLKRQKPKVEKNSSVQVAFGPGATSSTLTRTNSIYEDGNTGERCGQSSKEEGDRFSSVPSVDATDASGLIKREYKEPWDYSHTYYPTALPLRRPYSGDPELLDEAEFGEAAIASEYDESFINPAMELDLLEDSENVRMIFLQMPPNLPLGKRSASSEGKGMADSSLSSDHTGASARAKGKEIAGSSAVLRETGVSGKGCNLGELSEGYIGKMLVYKSGAVKLKLGEVLYDVSPGSDCSFAQDVVAINTDEKHCCFLGDLDKKAVISPNVDFLLDNVINLD